MNLLFSSLPEIKFSPKIAIILLENIEIIKVYFVLIIKVLKLNITLIKQKENYFKRFI